MQMDRRNSDREAATESAKAVANFFLACGWEEEIGIDQLKIQKLVYYAHAWHLAYDLGPLFPDDIEAWPHGPVVRDLYAEFCGFGKRPITHRALAYNGMEPDVPDEMSSTGKFLSTVWKEYKGYSGVRLSNATHGPDEPWTLIKSHYGDLGANPRIPNELIKQKFKEKLARSK